MDGRGINIITAAGSVAKAWIRPVSTEAHSAELNTIWFLRGLSKVETANTI